MLLVSNESDSWFQMRALQCKGFSHLIRILTFYQQKITQCICLCSRHLLKMCSSPNDDVKVSLYFQSILYVKNKYFGYKFRAKMVPKHGHYNSHLRALI